MLEPEAVRSDWFRRPAGVVQEWASSLRRARRPGAEGKRQNHPPAM